MKKPAGPIQEDGRAGCREPEASTPKGRAVRA
jgi:hypothetical protein